MRQSISIIVCFYNAEKKLLKTVQALKSLVVPASTFVELILVNNNSSDNSVPLLRKELKGFDKFSFIIIEEKIPGLTYARKAGIKAAKGELLLFCDDDNWLASNYLKKGLEVFISNKLIAVLGGNGSAVSDIELPKWFDHEQNYYAVGPQNVHSGEVFGQRNVVYGAGMWVKKAYYLKLISLGFDLYSTGRKGNQLSSGEDSELCLAFKIAGYKIWYSSELYFKHYITSDRFSEQYIQSLKNGMVFSRFVTRFYLDYLNGYRPKVGSFFWMKELYYTIKSLIKSNDKVDSQRSILLIKYLLKQRKQYNKDVKKVIKIADQLSLNVIASERG